MKVWMTAAFAATLVGMASAQNANAFKTVDAFTGVTIRQNGTMFELLLGQDATVTFNGRTHSIDNVQGFWLISDTGKLNATQSPIPNWDIHTNDGGQGSTAGWQTQQRNAIQQGGSMKFTFTQVNQSVLSAFGLKVHANGTPAHIRIDAQPVPEPATLAGLALGGAALLRRRKKQ
ncbi:MAG TPA: PEP-CTERM sorting domain-containing protein [Fimbriimonadaceae bacterium]|nr:PEP-CTERM sorting domain-containing protein [Fimbriimonadaceae bacterium]